METRNNGNDRTLPHEPKRMDTRKCTAGRKEKTTIDKITSVKHITIALKDHQ